MKNKLYNLIIFILLISNLIIFDTMAIGIIYNEPQIKDDMKRPIALEKKDENQITYSSDMKSLLDYEISIINQYVAPDTMEAYIEKQDKNKYTYIRHTSSITTVGRDYEWKCDPKDENKWRLFIGYTDSSILGHYAYSGFYKIGEDTYCFDKDGIMIRGLAIDEYDIVYVFDDSGRLINTYQLEK